MRHFGLIGYPLSHSFSERYFREKFRREKITGCLYKNYPLETIDRFPRLVAGIPGLEGLNVTIPYKQAILPYLDKLSDEAVEIGAVNTIRIYPGKILGFNTDLFGFTGALKPHLKEMHKRALVLGSGGASLAVRYALKQMDIGFLTVSRAPDRTQAMIGYPELTHEILQDHLLIINTTPLGMFPNVSSAPDIPYEALTTRHLLFDLVYNPPETQFMKLGRKAGARALNGLEMLRLQAEKSWEIWNRD